VTQVTLDSNDPRSLRALELTAASENWTRLRTDQGEPAYGIPSQQVAGRVYTVTSISCDCEAAHVDVNGDCKHAMAVRLFELLIEAHALRQHRR
jgi:hypothetical protein